MTRGAALLCAAYVGAVVGIAALAYREQLATWYARTLAPRAQSIAFERGRLWDDVREAIAHAG